MAEQVEPKFIRSRCHKTHDAYYGYIKIGHENEETLTYLGNRYDGVKTTRPELYSCCSGHFNLLELESGATFGGCIECVKFVSSIPYHRINENNVLVPRPYREIAMQTADDCKARSVFHYGEVRARNGSVYFALLQPRHENDLVGTSTCAVCARFNACPPCKRLLYLAQHVWRK